MNIEILRISPKFFNFYFNFCNASVNLASIYVNLDGLNTSKCDQAVFTNHDNGIWYFAKGPHNSHPLLKMDIEA